MELLSTLGVNMQLLLAQIVNFAIIMGVLLFFVYRPILRLVDSRRETIKKSMEDAKDIEKQKRDIEHFKTEQMRKADQEMAQILDKAKKQAETVKQDMLVKAQQEASALVEKAKETLQNERKKLLEEARGTLAGVAVKLAQAVLEREFSAQDQQRLVQNLEKDLPALLK